MFSVLASTMPFPATTATDMTAQAEDSEFSLVETANRVLGATLARQAVQRHGRNGFEAAVFPVAGVVLREGRYSSPVTINEDPGYASISQYDDTKTKPEHASLTVRLNRPAGDYDRASLTAAMQNVVKAIPALAGKIDEAPKPTARSQSFNPRTSAG